MTLDELPLRRRAVIKAINCPDKALKKHFLDMGLTPGTEIALIKTAPFGNPIEIRLRGYELTLRKEEAAKIIIENVGNFHRTPLRHIEFIDTEHPKIGEESENLKNPVTGVINFALAGNPNAGKTTLFNRLTGLKHRVGNLPGVTVEKSGGFIKNHNELFVTDLPGVYSLSPYSNEEIVTRNFILREKPDAIINIIDASNIERNLYLTLQLIELNKPIVIALNMMDEVMKSGGHIDINGFEAISGVPVVPISALKNEGIEELIEHAERVARYKQFPPKSDFCNSSDPEIEPVHSCIHSIAHIIEDNALAAEIPVRFAATKLVEGDTIMPKLLSLDENKIKICRSIIKETERKRKSEGDEAIADMRFSFIQNLCANFVQKSGETFAHKISMRIDKILTGKFTALPMFAIIMSAIFYLTFGPVGVGLSDFINSGINNFTKFIDALLTNYGLNPAIHSLITNGVFAGIGTILSFVPVIIVLFFFLSLLEDSGYMARVAFIMDKILRKTGLSGRSFIPLLIGFGCSVPAIMSTRTLPSERDRKMTILLIPFMSCSAKLPIYALFTAAFFKESQTLVITGLYLIGVIIGILFLCILKLFAFKGEPVPFVMELPNYRMPEIKNIMRLIFIKIKDFVTRAFTIILAASIIIWFLQHFDSRLNLISDSSKSILAAIGNFITPIFKPLGIDDWRISTAFLTGLGAKESVISTLNVLLAGDNATIQTIFTKNTAFVFLIFSLLYTPCAAAIATVRQELGKRRAFGVVFIQFAIAWLTALIFYKIGKFIS